MIPEHANWLVDNMSVTELHLYGGVLAGYPNVLSVMVEVISEHKPNQIHRIKKKPIDVGEDPIPTWLTIDVIDKTELGEGEHEILPLVDHGLQRLGTHTFELKNVELKNDQGEVLKTRVKVEFVDCLADGSRKDFMRYHRGLRIVFYV